jgi:hypothetical protein
MEPIAPEAADAARPRPDRAPEPPPALPPADAVADPLPRRWLTVTDPPPM